MIVICVKNFLVQLIDRDNRENIKKYNLDNWGELMYNCYVNGNVWHFSLQTIFITFRR